MPDRPQFERNIGLFMAVMIGIGAMMGPGIFALPGEVARLVGPLGLLVYLAMGAVTMFTALNYAELGAALPIAGGGYSMTQRTLPRPVSFLTGWFFFVGNVAACALYAVVFALTLREWLWPALPVLLVVVAVTLIFSLINLRGLSEALRVVTVMNLVELGVLLGVAILGLSHVEAPNLTPLAPMGWGGFLPGMSLIYVSYVGYELITVAAEEIIEPAKTIPRAIVITMVVAVAMYAFVVFVMMGTVHHTELSQTDVPFIFVADRLFGPWGRWAAVIATVMASLSAFAVTLGASARVLFALGRDGHFPRVVAKLDPVRRTPSVALGICAVGAMLLAATGVVKFVASMAGFGFLLGLGFVNLSVIALARTKPNLRRPYRVRGYPWVPIVGVVTSWGFVAFLEPRTIALGGVLTAAGLSVYCLSPANRADLVRAAPVARRFVKRLLRKRRPRMRVLIIGGGTVGQNIAQRLLARDEVRMVFRSHQHQITFVERDEDRCKELERRFGVPIFHGDGTKRQVLEQVGADEIDVAIAASDDDGHNVIAALQARQLGMPRVMAIVRDSDYLGLLEAEGVVAIGAPWATAAMVENYLDRPGVAELFEIGTGVASLIGVIIPERARVASKAIRDLEIPGECVVAAVIRGKEFVVPRGSTLIEVGDEVVFVGPPKAVQKARELFLISV